MSEREPTRGVELTTPCLEVRGVVKHFEGIRALRGVSATFHRGEVHALVGENGAGKSTLAKVIAGVYRPDEGELLRDGVVVAFADPRAAIESGISIVYQEPSLLPFLTVEENLVLGHEPHSGIGFVRTGEVRSQSERFLEVVGGRIRPNANVQELTIAERQLVEIAKALSLKAEVVVMDEPTSSLSITEVERLERVIERLRREGVAVILISHDLNEVFVVADRVTVLKDGEVTLSSAVAETQMDEVVRSMVGRDLAHLFPPREPPQGDLPVVLEVRHATIPGRAEDVSFELRAGEVTGFIGLIGAGRSDVARSILGLGIGRSGEVLLDGRPVRIRHPAEAVKLGIALVPEDRQQEGLVLGLSVAKNVALPQLDRLSRWSMVDRRGEQRLADEQIAALRIRATATTPTSELSGGNQQKVVLSKWLARGCRVLLLDEPTRGIDIGAKVEIYTLIRQLAADGAAVMLISSELPEILHLADRIVVMSKGRIVGDLENAVRAEADVAEEERLIRSALGLGTGLAEGSTG
jgi:ABC-type sugar transport system ATPase subunit